MKGRKEQNLFYALVFTILLKLYEIFNLPLKKIIIIYIYLYFLF